MGLNVILVFLTPKGTPVGDSASFEPTCKNWSRGLISRGVSKKTYIKIFAITCQIFGNRFRSVDSVGSHSLPFPLTRPVAIKMAGATEQPVITNRK